jgi:cell division protein ZapE
MTQTRSEDGVLAIFQHRIACGRLTSDKAQIDIANRLDRLENNLRRYVPRTLQRNGTLWRFGIERTHPVPRGVYLWGDVGRGKSMLMNLLFQCAPVTHKRRVHFNEFMLEIHKRIKQWRDDHPPDCKSCSDPIAALAQNIAREAWLLCFDEFQVTDIADAMILGRLFSALFDLGVVIVATSNWHPDDLYRDGLQRDLFLPFIAMIKERVDVIHLSAARDYRLDRARTACRYLWPINARSRQALENLFAELVVYEKAQPLRLLVSGNRFLLVPRAAQGVAWFDFSTLCRQPLGTADYVALATAFRVVLIEGVPCFTDDNIEEMMRFITLIDCLYEAKRCVAIVAATPIEQLYQSNHGAMEFQRSASRLIEMLSLTYIQAASVEPAASCMAENEYGSLTF